MDDLIIVSGHQPAYIPWLGYFHKILMADVFVYMDDVQFIERGFIHRNKIKTGPNSELMLTVPLKSKTKKGKINEVEIHSCNWQQEHFESIQRNYKKSKYFNIYEEDLKDFYLSKEWNNLNFLLYKMLKYFVNKIGIETKIKISSEEKFLSNKSDLIFEHAQKYDANVVFVGALGRDYIDEKKFTENKILINYQNYIYNNYSQRFTSFIPNLSILDLLFNVKPEELKKTILAGNLSKEKLKNEFYEKYKS